MLGLNRTAAEKSVKVPPDSAADCTSQGCFPKSLGLVQVRLRRVAESQAENVRKEATGFAPRGKLLGWKVTRVRGYPGADISPFAVENVSKVLQNFLVQRVEKSGLKPYCTKCCPTRLGCWPKE